MFVFVFISLSAFTSCFRLFSQSHYLLIHLERSEHFSLKMWLNIFMNCPFSVLYELHFWSASHEFNIFFDGYTSRQWIVHIHTYEIFKCVFASVFWRAVDMHGRAKGNASFLRNRALACSRRLLYPNSCSRLIPPDGISPACVMLMEFLAALVIL